MTLNKNSIHLSSFKFDTKFQELERSGVQLNDLAPNHFNKKYKNRESVGIGLDKEPDFYITFCDEWDGLSQVTRV